MRSNKTLARPAPSPAVIRSAVVAVVVGAELFAAAYVSLIAYLMSVWHVDDGEAFRMTDADWLLAGICRFLGWSLVAAGFACVVRFANRRCGLVHGPGFLSLAPVLMACLIALASGFGATMFVIDRPFW